MTMEKTGSTSVTLEALESEVTRYKRLPIYLKIIITTLATIGIGLCIFQTFTFSIAGRALFSISYYYALFAIFGACSFLILPARKKDKRVPWYDVLAFALLFGILMYFAFHGWEIREVGWIPASTPHLIMAIITFVLIMEAARRMGGIAYCLVCLILGLYPLYSSILPGAFYAPFIPFQELMSFHIFGSVGIIGLPAKAVGELLIGYLVFGGVLMACGAGQFFLDIALAVLGRFRGGPAKVSVVSSCLFGMLSGSGAANIVADGMVTIPAMKRTGFEPHFAAAVEACASTGGALMPPVMGSVAFVMAVFLGVPYYVVAVSAFIPAIFYYWALMMQVDAYAARHNLKGLPREELPSLWDAVKKGWHFITVLLFLIWALVYLRMGATAPFHASWLLIVLSFAHKDTMITPRKFLHMITTTAALITEAMAVILPIGFIVAGVTVTGAAASLTSVAVLMGQNNVVLILLIGFLVCYIMGMVGLVTPAYIFLAVSLAPAVQQVYPEVNPIGLHLFLVYYSTLAAITPPVATGAFIAATIAQAKPMKTALQTMRLGIVIYFVPFFFVFNPSLILQGPWVETIIYFILGVIGIIFIAAGVEGYLVFFGLCRIWIRPFLVIGGLLIVLPEWKSSVVGAVIVALAIAINLMVNRAHQKLGAYQNVIKTSVNQNAERRQ